ncbi:hypothetical protein ColTof4_01248 [Colletotrichum tofieldiae]|nr:hypothetical protein ColTof3_08487 [Colletotrichum tofieldiae]GKT68825.1 hypothetical protein ColTof4_01248 [Colletotrichum tofieldiae]GKT88599.1 hypothetical protein Ct61P_06449 [Colletotrichum tofieldiae]
MRKQGAEVSVRGGLLDRTPDVVELMRSQFPLGARELATVLRILGRVALVMIEEVARPAPAGGVI